jgi:uncharacterized protein
MLRDSVRNDFLAAVKARDKKKSEALRMVESVLKQVEIDTRKELSDDEVIKLLQKEVKKRQEAIELYKRADRQELVDKEEYEASLIKEYLPKQMEKAEVTAIVDQVVSSLSETANFGQVMQETMKQVAGKADGKLVSEVVREKLN